MKSRSGASRESVTSPAAVSPSPASARITTKSSETVCKMNVPFSSSDVKPEIRTASPARKPAPMPAAASFA